MKKSLITEFLLIIAALFLLVSTAYSEPPHKEWFKIYHNSSGIQDSAVAICVNSNGNVFVTGWIASSSVDVVTIRYNPVSGDTVWVKKFSHPFEDKPVAIIADNNFVYVTGWTFNSVTTRDILTIKYDASNGDSLWVREYNGPGGGGDYGLALDLDGSGNVYVAGRTDNGAAGQKMTVLKYDNAGNLPSGWPMIYTGGISGTSDEARSVKVDGSGNVYITGFTRNGAVSTDDYLTLKANSSGTVQWARKYIGNSNQTDDAIGLVLDASASNIFVTGFSLRAGTNQDIVTIKYSSAGDSLAGVIYNGPYGGGDVPVAITKDGNDNIYITGNSFSGGTGYDYITISYNTNLSQRWATSYIGPSGNDFPSSIAYAMGFVYVTGASEGMGTGFDYLTVRYDANTGGELWTVRENGGASRGDYATSIAVTDSNYVFVTGSLVSSGVTGNYYTIRYSELIGIKPISTNVPSNFDLKQNYPNPFNPSTKIRFDIPVYSFVKISVYDIAGREVAVLSNDYLRAGEYEADWNAAGYSSGIYFYRLVTDDYIQTRKMILVK
jgi:hypothetical protein